MISDYSCVETGEWMRGARLNEEWVLGERLSECWVNKQWVNNAWTGSHGCMSCILERLFIHTCYRDKIGWLDKVWNGAMQTVRPNDCNCTPQVDSRPPPALVKCKWMAINENHGNECNTCEMQEWHEYQEWGGWQWGGRVMRGMTMRRTSMNEEEQHHSHQHEQQDEQQPWNHNPQVES